ncbi:M14 family metallopeptidase [Nocardia amamiensis]|uniref:M14 family metallopeptidase n=1 Tax=Nocardia amamiensis TaxID=404578 RepID=UPI000A00DA19|nr:M14 family metallopeptidase [Nocardia amamiensis]
MAYLNVDEIESALQNLAAAYPSTTKLITAPHATHEGRSSHVLMLGTTLNAECDGVLMLGGVHAREWVPPDALISLAADLLEAFDLGTGLGYGGKSFTANEIRHVLEGVKILVYPCVNPDGRHFSQTVDSQWRKNRRPHPTGGGCIGVDINRNFDFLWDHLTKFAADSGVNTSADPCNAAVYRGPVPESEPETRNVAWLLDADPQIRWHVDVHSAVPVILHSWGSDDNQTAHPSQSFRNNAFDHVRGRGNDTAYGEYIPLVDLDIITLSSVQMDKAIAAVRGDNYGVAQGFGLYPTSGASDDYAYSRNFADTAKPRVYAFTVECGHSFQPMWTEAEDVIREVSAGLIAFCLQAADHATATWLESVLHLHMS